MIDDCEKLRGEVLFFRGIEAMTPGSGLEILRSERIVFVLRGMKKADYRGARCFSSKRIRWFSLGRGGGRCFGGRLRRQTRNLRGAGKRRQQQRRE